MADDDIMSMTLSELEIYRRTMFNTCFPKGNHFPRERLVRDILMLKAVSDSKAGAEAVEVARKSSQTAPPISRRVEVPMTEEGDTIAVPEPPLAHYNKAHIQRDAQRKRAKKAAEAVAAAANELETDTMEIKVPGNPATKRGPAIAAAVTRVAAPKPPPVSVEETSKAPRKPRVKKEPQGVVKAEALPAAAPVPEAAHNPFSRYVKPS